MAKTKAKKAAPAAGDERNEAPEGSSMTIERQKELARKEDARRGKQLRKGGTTRKFRLIRGRHFDARSGVSSERGGVVTSDLPLDKLEPARYAAIDPKAARGSEEDEEVAEVTSATETGTSPTHADEEVNEFPRTRSPEEAEELGVEAAEEAEEGEEDVEEGDPFDVTHRHPAAGKADVKVMKAKGGFNVVDKDDPDTPLQGDKPLKTSAEVNKFLKKKYGK
jgi:hypothetical protein